MLNIKRIVGACLVCISALGHAQNVPDTLNANQRRMYEALDSAINSSELSENEDVTVYKHLPKSYRYRVQLADKKQNRFSVSMSVVSAVSTTRLLWLRGGTGEDARCGPNAPAGL